MRTPQEPSDNLVLPKETKPAPPVQNKAETWRSYERPGFEQNGEGQLRATDNKAARCIHDDTSAV